MPRIPGTNLAFVPGINNSTVNNSCTSCSSKKANISHSHHQNFGASVTNTLQTNSTYLNESNFCSWGSTGSSNTNSFENTNCDDPKNFCRQNRGGSNHHFAYPSMTNHFQTVPNGGQQIQTNDPNNKNIQLAMPVTALVFANNSLPTNLLPINIQHHTLHQQNSSTQPLISPASLSHLQLLEKQVWFHGKVTRKYAESILENKPIGSFLIRQSESGNANDFSLSLVGSGCVHMRISMKNGDYILGQCSQPFNSIVKMVEHYGKVEVPIKGALHVKLTHPLPRTC